jgi:hypothetical protein
VQGRAGSDVSYTAGAGASKDEGRDQNSNQPRAEVLPHRHPVAAHSVKAAGAHVSQVSCLPATTGKQQASQVRQLSQSVSNSQPAIYLLTFCTHQPAGTPPWELGHTLCCGTMELGHTYFMLCDHVSECDQGQAGDLMGAHVSHAHLPCSALLQPCDTRVAPVAGFGMTCSVPSSNLSQAGLAAGIYSVTARCPPHVLRFCHVHKPLACTAVA